MEIFDERKTFEKYSSTPQKPRFRSGKSGWKSKCAKSPLYEPFDIQRTLYQIFLTRLPLHELITLLAN